VRGPITGRVARSDPKRVADRLGDGRLLIRAPKAAPRAAFFYWIFVMDPDGGNVRPVANTDGRATAPRWSPDCRTIYFTNGSHTMSASGELIRIDLTVACPSSSPVSQFTSRLKNGNITPETRR
jgi:hypothetical protein